LRHLARLAEDLRRRRLIEADLRVDVAERLEQRCDSDRGELGGEHRLLPGHRHERDGREVVDLVRTALAQGGDERELVQQVRLDQLDPVANALEVLIGRRRRAPHRPEDLVATLEEELGEQRPVLPSDAGDERAPGGHGGE
jgi:hypothetical protein